MRVRSLGLVTMFIVSIACSRVANQTNNIGAPCKTEGDCPSGLVCVDTGAARTCQHPCVNGNACEDANEVCVSGLYCARTRPPAEDASTAATDDAGALTTDGGEKDSGTKTDNDAQAQPPKGFSDAGTIVVEMVSYPSQLRASSGDYLAFKTTTKDQFNADVVKVHALRKDGSGGIVDLATVDKNARGLVIEANTLVFAAASGVAPDFKRVDFPSTTPTDIAPDFPLGTYDWMLAAGGATFWGGSSTGAIGRYVPSSNSLSTLDSSGAGYNPAAGVKGMPVVAVSGTDVYWIHDDGPAAGNPIYKASATSGAGGPTLGVVPNGDVAFFGVFGTDAIVAFEVAGQANFYRIDTTTAGSPSLVFSHPLQNNLYRAYRMSGEFVYVPSYTPRQIVKYSAVTGTKTVVVDLVNAAAAVADMELDATDVYWVEERQMSGSVPYGNRIAHAPK